jgi:hypothetical protein
MAKLDARWLPTMLATDADLQLCSGFTPQLHGDFDQSPYAVFVQHLEWILL